MLSEINLISERRVGDASAVSILSDDVIESQDGSLCRLKLSIIDIEFNYLIVSPKLYACTSYYGGEKPQQYFLVYWTVASIACIKRSTSLIRKPSLAI